MTRTTCLTVLPTILVYVIIFSFLFSFYLLKLYHSITHRIKTPSCGSWLANLCFLSSMEFFLEAKAISEHTCIAGGLLCAYKPLLPAYQVIIYIINDSVKKHLDLGILKFRFFNTLEEILIFDSFTK